MTLITMYRIIKNKPLKLVSLLEKHSQNHSKEYYYKLRSFDRDGTIDEMNNIEKSAQLLYMLRVNFNGLYRVNSKG